MLINTILNVNNHMSNKLYKVFTHGDLDGAVSLLCLLWAKPTDTVEYEELYNNTIEERLISYNEKTLNKPTTVVMDFSLRESFLNLDFPEFVFVDHHKSSEQYLNKFKNAKIVFKNTTSNTALMYNTFLKNTNSLTKEQKYLIALANDFDCYELKLPHSYDLNVLFWSEYRGKFYKFINDFKLGFGGFSQTQKNLIHSEKTLACSQADKLQKFTGTLNIKNTSYSTVAVIGERFNTLVNDCIIHKYNPDLFFYINTKTEKVNMRKKPSIQNFDIGLFAEEVCEGGGNLNSGGGKLTPLLMEFMKNLKPE
jgi:oligoribonuclease NrnB/cAMP/cGMP phosphodiesterase (DHH superfamily)